MNYSKNHKEAILKKMMPPDQKTIPQISREEGTPAGWNSKDKFLDVLETASLSEIEISEYCRKKGIYPERWSEATRNWEHQTKVWINPVRSDRIDSRKLVDDAA